MFEKLRIPILTAITFLGGATGAGISWGVTNERVEQVRQNVSKLETHEDDHRKRDIDTAERIKSLEVQTQTVVRSLERIEDRLGTK